MRRASGVSDDASFPTYANESIGCKVNFMRIPCRQTFDIRLDSIRKIRQTCRSFLRMRLVWHLCAVYGIWFAKFGNANKLGLQKLAIIYPFSLQQSIQLGAFISEIRVTWLNYTHFRVWNASHQPNDSFRCVCMWFYHLVEMRIRQQSLAFISKVFNISNDTILITLWAVSFGRPWRPMYIKYACLFICEHSFNVFIGVDEIPLIANATPAFINIYNLWRTLTRYSFTFNSPQVCHGAQEKPHWFSGKQTK